MTNSEAIVNFLESDEYLRDQCIAKNCERLRKKIDQGVFERERALKSWYSVALWGAKEYARQLDTFNIKYYELFSVEDRKQAAEQLQTNFENGVYLEGGAVE